MPDSKTSFQIRRAGREDVEVIAHHRAAMFRDMKDIPAEDYPAFKAASVDWLRTLFTRGLYAGWLVEHEGEIVAGGGVLLREMGPTPGSYRLNKWAHIVNVYTEAEYRRRGLARTIVQAILDWCAEEAFDMVTLAASDEGRPLYTALGFVPTNDMRLKRR